MSNMKENLKELLLKDLCARLPYGVILHDEYCKKDYKLNSIDVSGFINYDIANSITHIKPYLRPMSSMTEKERIELSMLTDDKFKFYLYTYKPEIVCYEKYNYLEGLKVLDWLNSHNFDYRGLIEKGLALEAHEDMYKF